MYHIKTFNAIAPQGLADFTADYAINQSEDPDAYLIRSVDLYQQTFSKNLKAIARCGAGYNNVPLDRALANGTVVFNTPGGNANAVKELIIANMIIANRNIIAAANWTQKVEGADVTLRTEKEKTAFNGTELRHKKLAVIGLGHVGSLVANAASDLGMQVIGYDPYLSADAAWHINQKVKRATSLIQAIQTADFVTIHVPKNVETTGLIGTSELTMMKPDAVLLNFSRLGIVDNQAAITFLRAGKLRQYITDFSSKEILHEPKVTIMPHIGGSTIEAEVNCAKLAVAETKAFLETGNIQNAVNMPDVQAPFQTQYRFTLMHRNVPNMIGQISTLIADAGINIENLVNSAQADYAYTMVDTNQLPLAKKNTLLARLNAIDSMKRVRILCRS
ncbi:3-phosphoglycerate dehydrogenase family protein [Agrilactobacillus fermenti]|uniref:3-phosphoglycerate dehydrogenase family protein n=1 Tax=Agrilactobacillus fermenti TaxID=2586909 RepID=UPI003A5C5670